MKKATKFLIAAGLVTFIPAIANAKGVTPGEYTLSGIQRICIKSDGTWYGTTFPSWGGHYQIITVGTVKTTYIYGNYAAGAGNDSLVVLGLANSKWTEWRDGLAFEQVLVNVAVRKLSRTCAPPAAPNRVTRSANPAS